MIIRLAFVSRTEGRMFSLKGVWFVPLVLMFFLFVKDVSELIWAEITAYPELLKYD